MVMDAEGARAPRRFAVRPRRLVAGWVASVVLSVGLAVALIVFTPVRESIPGYGTEEVRRSARLSALRVEALRDSLAVQREYMVQLQRLIMGEADTSFVPALPPPASDVASSLPHTTAPSESAAHWRDHMQPALPALPATQAPATVGGVPASATRAMTGLRLPMLLPVEGGYLTRGFDARTGHFAIDLAVEEGTPVRAVGDGHVVLADWTQGGGYTVAVQHAGGYASIYKHNARLLKRVGERVRERETIALSGNTGEITTGPHLHFELWHDGLAQDPRPYMAGL